MLYLNTDGGSRGNPGPSAIAFVLKDSEGNLVKDGGDVLGTFTNNVAEYTALIRGLNEAFILGEDTVVCRLDSELVVKQLNGEYKVKDKDMAGLFRIVQETLKHFKAVKFVHVPRSENKEADKIVNEFLDGKRKSSSWHHES